MSAVPASPLPTSVVTRVVPPTGGLASAPDPDQGLLWDEPVLQGTAGGPAPGPDTDTVPPELTAWARRFAQAVVEVVAGHRPSSQLVRWTTKEVYRDLERRTRLAQRAAAAAGGMPVQRSTLLPQVRSVHLCPLGPGVVEASVHVRHGRRSRAVALRLEDVSDRWRCTALEFA